MKDTPRKLFRPQDVLRGIAEKFGRELSESAVTTTRDRHPGMFEKAENGRGAFRINPEFAIREKLLAPKSDD